MAVPHRWTPARTRERAGRLLRADPVLYAPGRYRALRRKNQEKRRREFREILAEASAIKPCRLFEEIRSLLETRAPAPGAGGGVDPYFSTTVRTWIDAVRQGVQWIRQGVDEKYLEYVADRDAFHRDLAAEYPDAAREAPPPRSRVIHGIRLLPVTAIATSPRLAARVQDCLPHFPNPTYYHADDDETLDRLAMHLDQALGRLEEIDAVAYAGLRLNVHTIYGAVLRARASSLGSRDNCPGTMLAGISAARLGEKDAGTTAAQLYHEHCHTKLSLLLGVCNARLSPDAVLVSPFKNEVRDITAILHQVYPLTMECLVYTALLQRDGPGAARDRTVATLAALVYRLQLIAGHLGALSRSPLRGVGSALRKTVDALVRTVGELVARSRPALRDAHLAEQRRILARHTWDIGQFLCRGVPVSDPDLTEVVHSKNTVQFRYRGRRHRARPERPRASPGGYGSYIAGLVPMETR